MDNFFSYQPISICAVINVKSPILLTKVKDALYSIVKSLESETEDKVIVYDGSGTEKCFNFLGESVAAISNYTVSRMDLPIAVRDSLFIVSETPCGSRKKVLVFTEKFSEQDVGKVEESLRANRRYNIDAKVHMIVFGEEDKLRAERIVDPSYFVYSFKQENFVNFLREILENDRPQEHQATPDQADQKDCYGTTNTL